jgi:predicted acylesterase/phospholipase RssA
LPNLPPPQQTQQPRDRHLFGPGRKRILSLDGGGVRGIVSLAFLERIEAMVEAIEGRPTRLCDWFDLIGGTSTGAIIASALALGHRVADIRLFYENLAPKIFRRSRFRLLGLQAKFDSTALEQELQKLFGARTLDSPDLQTGLSIILKRMDSGSAWILANNPRSKFWETPADGAFIGNRHMTLANIVRASTAAPSYFDPELMTIVPGEAPGLFVDGGLTPHNNPALALTMVALLPAFGLEWRTGPDQLLIVSVGTGSFRPTLSADEAMRSSAIGLALKSLVAMVAESQLLTLTLMTYLGQSPVPWPINSEIGDLGRIVSPKGDFFRFLRYDLCLEQDWLARELGATLAAKSVAELRNMDDPRNMDTLFKLASSAAARQIKLPDLGFAASDDPSGGD